MNSKAILLVPSSKYQDDLLREGPCGARAPRAWRYGVLDGKPIMDLATPWSDAQPEPWLLDPEHGDPCWQGALVLAWGGVVVPEGCDRAARVLAALDGMDPSTGVLWRHGSVFSSPPTWVLMSNEPRTAYGTRCYAPPSQRGMGEHVADLATPPANIGALLSAWALATVCASRGLGTIVTLGDTP